MGIDVALNDIKRLTPNYTVSVHLTHCPGLLSIVTQAREMWGLKDLHWDL